MLLFSVFLGKMKRFKTAVDVINILGVDLNDILYIRHEPSTKG